MNMSQYYHHRCCATMQQKQYHRVRKGQTQCDHHQYCDDLMYCVLYAGRRGLTSMLPVSGGKLLGLIAASCSPHRWYVMHDEGNDPINNIFTWCNASEILVVEVCELSKA